MEVIVRSSEDSGQGVEVAPGQILPPIRSFMDDLTLLNSQPQITESPIKSLGYTKELKDTNRAKEIIAQMNEGLASIERSGLPE